MTLLTNAVAPADKAGGAILTGRQRHEQVLLRALVERAATITCLDALSTASRVGQSPDVRRG